MSAVIGILNKRAVALAADSAATLHNGKIINKADKIFALSKHYPIGVTIHNSDSFMGTPWDIIIKLYRQQLKNACFDTLEDYQKHFIQYLYNENFHCDKKNEDLYLDFFVLDINREIIRVFNRNRSSITAVSVEDKANKELEMLKDITREFQKEAARYKTVLPDFVSFTIEEFKARMAETLETVLDVSFNRDAGIEVDGETKDLLLQTYFLRLIHQESRNSDYTGITFAGYGEKEIFPSIIALQVYIGFSKRLRYFVNTNKSAQITHSNPSEIHTFAQSDVMFTVLQGVAPDLKDIFRLNFENFLNDFDRILLENYPSDKTDLTALLASINKDLIVENFEKAMNQAIFQKYTNPLFESVASLSKEDMGEMAESLIHLTYMQRRITNAEESVGGPVDVAILSKNDGFIWLKRKHYFKADLNPYFFHKNF